MQAEFKITINNDKIEDKNLLLMAMQRAIRKQSRICWNDDFKVELITEKERKKFMNQTAQTCPVCRGNGLVPNGFYNQTSGNWSTGSTGLTATEKCKSCNGSGVVWPE